MGHVSQGLVAGWARSVALERVFEIHDAVLAGLPSGHRHEDDVLVADHRVPEGLFELEHAGGGEPLQDVEQPHRWFARAEPGLAAVRLESLAKGNVPAFNLGP
jgi:hypothetical protein